MKIFVAMNKETGKLHLAIKMSFYDPECPIYNGPDGYLVTDDKVKVWVFVLAYSFEKHCEILGEL